jgi:hypothetical protein
LPAILGLGFLSGFISLAFEISLFRAFSVFNPSSPYNFPGVVPFLLSIAGGSILLTRLATYTTDRALRRVGRLFLLAIAGMLLGILGSVGLSTSEFRWAFRQSPVEPLAGPFRGILVYGLVLVVPFAFCQSGVFPLLLRLASPTGQSLPATTGWVALVNAVGAVVLASEQPVTLDRGRAEAVLAPRAQEIGLAPPYADWLLTDWRSITRAEVGRRRPIRDDLLIYEYQFDPLGWLVGSRRRQAGSRRDAAARSGFTEASSTPDARGSRARHPGRSRKTR